MITGDYISNSISPYSPLSRDPILIFTASPGSGSAGNPTNVTLTWSSDLGVSASIDQGLGPVALVGSVVITGLTVSRTWTFSVTKLNGAIVTKQVTYTAT